jgi:triacylglycerol lipase
MIMINYKRSLLKNVLTLLLSIYSVDAALAQKSANKKNSAVIILSGGAAISPFTTPNQACKSGLAAGNTSTALREYLLQKGHLVFTAPSMFGRGQVKDQTGFGAFSDCPVILPEVMTYNSVGDIDLAGEKIARFINYLNKKYNIQSVDLVGHSMGGLFSRAAIKILQETESKIKIRSLTTIGTPWEGTYLADYTNSTIPMATCNGDEFCEKGMKIFKKTVDSNPPGAGGLVTRKVLAGADGWNEAQGNTLSGIPVVMIGGNYFNYKGTPEVWPNDGIVALDSALASNVSDNVIPHRRCHIFPNTHSIFISSAIGADWTTGLTWNPEVLKAVDKAIKSADNELKSVNREGCPGHL